MPFTGDSDAPWWVRAGLPEPWADQVLPEVPAELLDVPVLDELPVECGCCVEPAAVLGNFHHVPDALADRFALAWGRVQQETARMWRAADAMCAAVNEHQLEFVGDDIGLIARLHPRTGTTLALTARGVCAVPELIGLVATGELSGEHAKALLDEAGKWTDTDTARERVLELTLQRTRAWVDKHGCWPTPGELRRRLRTAAVLLDLSAAEKAKRSVAERRGVSLCQSGVGQGTLTIEGPDVQLVQVMDCLRARAESLGQLPGDTRSLPQRLYDAALELFSVDADGGESTVPTLDEQGVPVTIRVRGVEVSVIVPYSVATGGDLELAEIPGYGPILPSTTRELLAQAEHVRRVAIDADTGKVIAVDDRQPGPARERASAARPDPVASPDLTDQGNRDDRLNESDEPVDGPLDGPVDRLDDRPDQALHDDQRDGPTDDSSDETDETDDEPVDNPDDGPDNDLDDHPGDGPGSGDWGPDEGGMPRPPDGAPSTAVDPEPDRQEPPDHDPPAPSRTSPSSPDAPSSEPDLLAVLLHRLAAEPVVQRDLRTSSYRVNGRIRRFIQHRDRTCTFPGCTVPGRFCDADHREPWPHGPTDPANCHCLCRRHHRGKQCYFTVTVDQRTGDTLWTTPDGRTYRRPPPTF